MDFSIQQATQRPKIVSTGEYAQMRNYTYSMTVALHSILYMK